MTDDIPIREPDEMHRDWARKAHLVERFVRYWLQDTSDGPIYRQPGVDVEYDF